MEQPVVLQLAPVNPPEPEKRETAPHPNAGSYKSLLFQYTQKLSRQPPIFQTSNEGAQHKPQFRSRVWVDGAFYTSPNTFSQRRLAETEASKVAFEAIMKKIKDKGAKLVRENIVFCKSILTEYAVRMNLEIPDYETTRPDMSFPGFSSSLVFNGATYTGEFARSKLEAQRLVARAVILSILDSESGNIMSEIINSKFKLQAALNKAKSSFNDRVGTMPGVVHTGNDNGIQLNKANEVEVATGSTYMPTPSMISESYLGQPTSLPATDLSVHLIQPPNPETPTAVVTPPVILLAPILETTPLVSSTSAVVTPNILVPPVLEQTPLVGSTSAVVTPNILVPPVLEQTPLVGSTSAVVTPNILVPPVLEQTPLVGSTSAVVTPNILVPPVQTPLAGSTSGKKRHRRNKKKAQKKARLEAQLPLNVVPLSQIPSCSVSQ